MEPGLRPLHFIRSSQDDLRKFPKEVRHQVGFSLKLAQMGEKALNTVPLIGFRGASVLEVISDHDGNTFRCVYTVRFGDAVYVLHAFQKKSKTGIRTPTKEMNLVRLRLRDAEKHHKENYAKERRAKSGTTRA